MRLTGNEGHPELGAEVHDERGQVDEGGEPRAWLSRRRRRPLRCGTSGGQQGRGDAQHRRYRYHVRWLRGAEQDSGNDKKKKKNIINKR